MCPPTSCISNSLFSIRSELWTVSSSPSGFCFCFFTLLTVTGRPTLDGSFSEQPSSSILEQLMILLSELTRISRLGQLWEDLSSVFLSELPSFNSRSSQSWRGSEFQEPKIAFWQTSGKTRTTPFVRYSWRVGSSKSLRASRALSRSMGCMRGRQSNLKKDLRKRKEVSNQREHTMSKIDLFRRGSLTLSGHSSMSPLDRHFCTMPLRYWYPKYRAVQRQTIVGRVKSENSSPAVERIQSTRRCYCVILKIMFGRAVERSQIMGLVKRMIDWVELLVGIK